MSERDLGNAHEKYEVGQHRIAGVASNSASFDRKGCIMSLIDVALPASTRVSQNAIAFIAEADRRIEQLYQQHTIPAFVPSDFERVFKR